MTRTKTPNFWTDAKRAKRDAIERELTGKRLSFLAKYIEEKMPHYVVTLEPWETNTDRKCGRLRIPGKGRQGHRLTVWRKGQQTWGRDFVMQHESGETYRRNSDVVRWIGYELIGFHAFKEKHGMI